MLELANLAMVETVDSVKLAKTLNKAVEARYQIFTKDNIIDGGRSSHKVLPVMIQVNTSGEESIST